MRCKKLFVRNNPSTGAWLNVRGMRRNVLLVKKSDGGGEKLWEVENSDGGGEICCSWRTLMEVEKSDGGGE